MSRYIWICRCENGCYFQPSKSEFITKESCYKNMRGAALEKMTWNTELEDFENENELIEYKVYFSPNEIRHVSYSGEYVYKIVEIK